ncbi:MAG: hypothetical protein SF339_25200 [Blastocatellia bacterium]|nr:hypothetical protein [Blastocatellia bacterium]
MTNLRSKTFHKSWLLVTAIVVGVGGPVFSLATVADTEELARWTLDLLAWPIDGRQQYSEGAMRFLTALTGGFLFGWGAMIFCLRQWVYDLAPEPTRRAVVAGLVAWFLLDSTGSIAAGVPSNAVFNVLVLLLAVGPLWRSAE